MTMKTGHNVTSTIVAAFVATADRCPQNTAVKVLVDGNWHDQTYAELCEYASIVATELLERGVQPGDAIVVPSQRTPLLCGQLLGILWAGGHYVFIDPEYPLERQTFIHQQSAASIGLYDGSTIPLPDIDIDWHCATGDSYQNVRPDIPLDTKLPAYVTFTSGSTGTPKGVVVPHAGVYRLVLNTDYISFAEAEVFLQLSTLSFDLSTLEIWGPLLNGGTCVLYPESFPLKPAYIKEAIVSQQVTTLWLTSSLYNAIIMEHPDTLASVKQLLVGGEALSFAHIKQGLSLLPNTRIFNGYGPTENTTFTTVYPIPRQLDDSVKRIPIGFPIPGTTCDVFDTTLKPVPDGEVGELIAFGDGVAEGYLNRPELTAERFVDIVCRDRVTRRGYRTGDLVTKLADGSYDYLGRNDTQVKIDGHRIEPGEIEQYLNELDGIIEARVLVKIGPQGQKRLAAYVVGRDIDRTALRQQLSDSFPRFMVPHFIIPMTSLPKNQNGKLDTAKLPDPFNASPEKAIDNQSVSACWSEILGRAVTPEENFLDAGGTSIEAIQLTELLEERFTQTLGATFVFEYPTIATQTRYLRQDSATYGQPITAKQNTLEQTEFAVIGMTCRFPGAGNIDQFWDNLLQGKESISFFSEAELSTDVDPAEKSQSSYIKAKGVLPDYDQFDAEFFGISPLEADLMDPQQRVLLMMSWHALEDAGYLPGDEQSLRTGVFVGMNWARYYQQYVIPNREILQRFGAFNAAVANEPDFLSTRISYKLNLKGPSVNVYTACSTGLVAIAQACASIEQNQCEMAIAGGVSISFPVYSGYLYQEGGMLSQDGHCRPFDANASGTTFNDGAGLVVLKRLDLAQQDHDRVYAVIKGYAVNNDGAVKASFTAPSVSGQVAVYNEALSRAAIDPNSVGFIEAHGTATPLGDPIEVEALRQSYTISGDIADDTTKRCALGSVKSNIGHTIHAAGVASFIKAVLAVQHGKIPPTLFYEKPNPKLALDKTPFYVNAVTEPWQAKGPRRAAVTSLGVGGTNAHVIIEQAPTPAASIDDTATDNAMEYTLVLSARCEEALQQQIQLYQAHFDRQASTTSALNAAFTAALSRKTFPYRAAVSGRTTADFAKRLADKKSIVTGQNTLQANGKIGFLFSGQGAQRLQMGYWLYQHNPDFRQLFDKGCDLLRDAEGFDVRAVLFNQEEKQELGLDIDQTKVAQPALFLLEYGLAKHLMSQGVKPDFLLGHSIGEFAAATLAGVFSFEDAITLVGRRGALMQSMPPGQMLVVKTHRDNVDALLDDETCLAAVNAPESMVIAGPASAIQRADEELKAKQISTVLLHTSHAFHSNMMQPVAAEFKQVVAAVSRQAPSIPIISTATGELLSAAEAQSPDYWASQLLQPVLFADAIANAGKQFGNNETALVEIGPGNTLATLASYQPLSAQALIAPILPSFGTDERAPIDISKGISQLWVNGYPIDWRQQFANLPTAKISLPGYAFLPKKHSLCPPNTTGLQTNAGLAASMPAISVPTEAATVQQLQATQQHLSIQMLSGANIATSAQTIQPQRQEVTMSAQEHLEHVQSKLKALFEDVTGYDLGNMSPDAHFSEVGLDSLLLTQIATALERAYESGITFRHLVEEYTCLDELSNFMAEYIPVETKIITDSTATATMGESSAVTQMLPQAQSAGLPPATGISDGPVIQQVVNAQLQIMQMQLQALSGGTAPNLDNVLPATSSAGTTTPQPAAQTPAPTKASTQSSSSVQQTKADEKPKARHTPGTRITREKLGIALSNAQQEWVDDILQQYQTKYASSKAYAQKHRRYFADPRSVSGFNPEWKEIVFPIVTEKSKGSKLWDIDGNELIDTSNGFGPILFGHSPDFLTAAVKQQLDLGIETGPQSPVAGEVAKLFCELTGNERCTFASTGSEAVAGALRLARTVTGRTLVVMFEGGYHGIFDEVINRPGKDYQALPAAPGIPREKTSQMLVLPWGEASSLETIKSLSSDLAAVLVEPVQSRKPEFHDAEYLRAIRDITRESNTALIFDEVVTGFRVHPGGIQQRFQIDADLATYGKVVGGGHPIGIIGGKAKFMDALDGGHWSYGDESIPECGVTFFAGTFVRHPISLVSAKAIMERIKAEGNALYEALEEKTTGMAQKAQAFIKELKCEVTFESFASLFYVAVPANAHWGHLLFTLMTLEGIHIQQYRPNFLTTEHNAADVEKILSAFQQSLAKMVVNGLIDGDMVAAKQFLSARPSIPAGARLGKNAQGQPAYFIADPNNKGKYIEVGKP